MASIDTSEVVKNDGSRSRLKQIRDAETGIVVGKQDEGQTISAPQPLDHRCADRIWVAFAVLAVGWLMCGGSKA